MLKDVRYKISWETIGNIRNNNRFKHSASSAGHIAPTLKNRQQRPPHGELS